MRAQKTLEAFIKLLPAGSTVLDIGPGQGEHTARMERAGLDVKASMDWPVDSWRHAEQFDGAWCCHVLEHSPNPGMFLNAIRYSLKVGGVLGLVVPPMKRELVDGHVTMWSPGLLLYHLVLAGFDCSRVNVDCYGYNIAVIVTKGALVDLEGLSRDCGDIEIVAKYMPGNVQHGDDMMGVGV